MNTEPDARLKDPFDEIERLYEESKQAKTLYRETLNRAVQAERELERYATSVHTCHDQCPRVACVQRREIERLLAKADARRVCSSAAGAVHGEW